MQFWYLAHSAAPNRRSNPSKASLSVSLSLSLQICCQRPIASRMPTLRHSPGCCSMWRAIKWSSVQGKRTRTSYWYLGGILKKERPRARSFQRGVFSGGMLAILTPGWKANFAIQERNWKWIKGKVDQNVLKCASIVFKCFLKIIFKHCLP